MLEYSEFLSGEYNKTLLVESLVKTSPQPKNIWSILRFSCRDGGIGRHEGLKILWPEMTVWVQVPLAVLNFISLEKLIKNINLKMM